MSVPCRMAAVGEEEAIQNIKAWSGTPKDARLVCAPSPSDAGVIATLLRYMLPESCMLVAATDPLCLSCVFLRCIMDLALVCSLHVRHLDTLDI